MKNDSTSIFNRTIKSFILKQPNSSSAKTIGLFEKYFPKYHNNYYLMFDSLSLQLGISWETNDIGNGQYAPKLLINDNNKLDMNPGIFKEVDEDNPYNLEGCYTFIANELIYLLQSKLNLEQILKEISQK